MLGVEQGLLKVSTDLDGVPSGSRFYNPTECVIDDNPWTSRHVKCPSPMIVIGELLSCPDPEPHPSV